MMLLPLLVLLLPRIANFLSLSDSLSCLLRVASWLVGWWVPVQEMLAQCQMPTRAQDLLSLTPSPPVTVPFSVTLQEGGGVQDSAAATSRCIIINVRTNEADVPVKYDEGRQDMCRHSSRSCYVSRWTYRPKQTHRKLRQKFNVDGNI